jgi:hypothetical protein
MPWELGYVDGYRQSCAIVPVAENTQISYTRSEYLLLYPEILKPNPGMRGKDSLYVIEDANTYVGFPDWFQGSKPIYRSDRFF